MSWFRKAISKIYNTVSAPAAATRDALLADRVRSVRDTVTFYYNKAKEQISGTTTLHDEVQRITIEDEYQGIADLKHMFGKEEKEQATNPEGIEDIQHIFDENDTQMLEDGNRIKTWRFNKNLNQPLTEGMSVK